MACNESRAVRHGHVAERVHQLAQKLRVDKANSCVSFAAICPTGGMDADLGSIRVIAMSGPLDRLWETDASRVTVFAIRNPGLHISPGTGNAIWDQPGPPALTQDNQKHRTTKNTGHALRMPSSTTSTL